MIRYIGYVTNNKGNNMTKATIKRLFPKKQWCIAQDVGVGMISYWEGGFMWSVNDNSQAKVGTKRELKIKLNNFLYQHKLRNARVIRF